MKMFSFAGDAPLEEFPDAEDVDGVLQIDVDSDNIGSYLNIRLYTDGHNYPVDITLRYKATTDFHAALKHCRDNCTQKRIYRFYECEELVALVNVRDQICVLYGGDREGLILTLEDINLILKALQPYTPGQNCPRLLIYLDTGCDE